MPSESRVYLASIYLELLLGVSRVTLPGLSANLLVRLLVCLSVCLFVRLLACFRTLPPACSDVLHKEETTVGLLLLIACSDGLTRCWGPLMS